MFREGRSTNRSQGNLLRCILLEELVRTRHSTLQPVLRCRIGRARCKGWWSHLKRRNCKDVVGTRLRGIFLVSDSIVVGVEHKLFLHEHLSAEHQDRAIINTVVQTTHYERRISSDWRRSVSDGGGGGVQPQRSLYASEIFINQSVHRSPTNGELNFCCARLLFEQLSTMVMDGLFMVLAFMMAWMGV